MITKSENDFCGVRCSLSTSLVLRMIYLELCLYPINRFKVALTIALSDLLTVSSRNNILYNFLSLEIYLVRYLEVSTSPSSQFTYWMTRSLWNVTSRITRSLCLNGRALI
jgi:hypothetical protein